MTLRPRDKGAEETFTIDLSQEFYLKERDEPIAVNSTYEIRKDVLDEGQEMEDLMGIATQHLLATIDVVGEHRHILSDGAQNKFVFFTDQIQAVSILAPSKETLMSALEEV